MLIAISGDTQPIAYTRVAAAERKIEQDDWVAMGKPEQRLLALV
jgi:hypothetical protein